MDYLPISSREFAGTLVPPAEYDAPAARTDTAEDSPAFERFLAEASNPEAPGQPTPQSERPHEPSVKAEPPTDTPATTARPRKPSRERRESAEPAQELPARTEPADRSQPTVEPRIDPDEPHAGNEARASSENQSAELPPESIQPPRQRSSEHPTPAQVLSAPPLPPDAPPPAPLNSAAESVELGSHDPPAAQSTGHIATDAAPASVGPVLPRGKGSAPLATASPNDASMSALGQSIQQSKSVPAHEPVLPQPGDRGPAESADSAKTPPSPTGAHSADGSAGHSKAASFLELQPQNAPTASGQTTNTSSISAPASSPSTAGPPPSPSTQAQPDTFNPQIVRGALAMTRTTGGAMTMRLEPESLGSLRIQMQMSQGRVAIQFHAETAEARGLLNQHVQTLRQAMETHGLKLDAVQIHTLARSGSSASTGQEHSSSHSNTNTGGEQSSKHDAGGQQSRGHADTSEREAQYRQAARQFARQAQRQAAWSQQWSSASAVESTDSRTPAP